MARPNTTVTAVERVLSIFEAFGTMGRPMSLTELAERVAAPKSSVHAIVGTLIQRGYLYSFSRPRALYPTRRLYDAAVELLEHDPLLEHTTQLLERLRDTSTETVILGKRQGNAVIYLHVLEGLNAIRYSARPGEFKPLHSSAMGKALLGRLPPTELRPLLESLERPAVTASTIVSIEALTTDIAESRRRGYSLTRGENVPDVWALAATITLGGETLGVTLAGPRHRIEPSVDEAARLLMATCHLLERSLKSDAPPRRSKRHAGLADSG
jgi:IclR family transcriptional regulator, acetate operon repressor